jgi:hypothetical protein
MKADDAVEQVVPARDAVEYSADMFRALALGRRHEVRKKRRPIDAAAGAGNQKFLSVIS